MHEWNELERATGYLERGIELCLQWGHADALITGYTTLARVELAQGAYARAVNTFSRVEQLHRKTAIDPWAICWIDDCRLRLWLAASDLPAATAWAAESGLTAVDPLSFVRDLEHVNLARVRVAQGLHQPVGPWLGEALALLARLAVAAAESGWVGREIEVYVLRAVALAASGKGDAALDALDRALALGEPEGYVRTFVDEGAPVRDLLVQAVARGMTSHQDYAGRLLAAFAAAAGGPKESPPCARRDEWHLVDPLTERELQVLRLMSTDLNSTEIAEELVVSVNTVRSHVQHIYQKLAVHSRHEAVSRARETGLL
jgi:LuxR family maltose regulon positive regulatory protein